MNQEMKLKLKLELMAQGAAEGSALHEDFAAIIRGIERGRTLDADAFTLATYAARDAVALQEALNVYREGMQARADAARDAIETIAIKSGVDIPPPEGRTPAGAADEEAELARGVSRKFTRATDALKAGDAEACAAGFRDIIKTAFGDPPIYAPAAGEADTMEQALTLWRKWRRGERIIAAAKRLTLTHLEAAAA